MSRMGGDVTVLGVGNLLQILYLSQAHGFLNLERGGRRKTLEVTPHGLRVVGGARKGKPLGEILLQSGRITKAQLLGLLSEQKKSGKPLGELVADRGIVSRGVIQGALRKQVSEEVYDLLTWTEGTFEFRTLGDGPTPPDEGPFSKILLDSNVMSLMLGAAHRTDELARIRASIPDDRLIPLAVELPSRADDPELDPEPVEELLPLLDGQRSIGDLVAQSLFPQFTVLRTFHLLTERGMVKVRDKGEEGQAPMTVVGRGSSGSPDGPPGRVILVLGEGISYRGSLAFLFKTLGFKPVEGGNPREWGEMAGGVPSDLIVLDVALDTPEGLEHCKRVREKSSAPLIVLTPTVTKQAVRNALESGARHVLVKPVKEKHLVGRVAGIFR